MKALEILKIWWKISSRWSRVGAIWLAALAIFVVTSLIITQGFIVLWILIIPIASVFTLTGLFSVMGGIIEAKRIYSAEKRWNDSLKRNTQ